MDDIKTYLPHHKSRFWMVLLVIVLMLLLFIYFHHKNSSHHQENVAPVVTAIAKQRDVSVYLSALGNVTPTQTITVKTQINGQLWQVFFKEGQFVKAGEVLAQIDPRPYEVQLIQYQGQLERDEALLSNARLDLMRYQKLWKQDSIAKQALDTQVSLVHQYEGTVQIDKGLIAAAKLNLIYCRITSPVNGRIGLRRVDPGNFVQTADVNGLFVIDTLDPITVIFSIPEDSIQDIVQLIYAGKTLPVNAYDRQGIKLLATGTVLTMDNQIDPTTGTVKVRAIFANPNNILFPSQFVNIKLLVKTLNNAVVVPTAAIQYGAQGAYVYIVNTDKTVHMQTVTVEAAKQSDVTVIQTGLKAGQVVVIEGVNKLIEGAKVTIAHQPYGEVT